jgi:Fic family protein
MAQIAELLERINTAKAELDQLRPLDKEREARVMQKFRLWWTYHSNAIEGNSLTQGETETFLMEGLTAKGKPLKDHLDLKGHSDAINFLLALVRSEQQLTEVDIRELHKVLLVEPYRVEAITSDGKPTTKEVAVGQYKTSANHVRTPTGETHFYATLEETPAKMHDLMTWYREESEKGIMPLVFLAARFHHRFTAIHPFDDGNGRMSRLLMNLILMQAGYPPVVIRNDERNAYLAALRAADRGEYDEFIYFIGEHALESLNVFVRAAKGEEISEPTDLHKEIALEILRLKHIEEPAEQTQKNTWALFRGSIQQLVRESASLIVPFGELFTESFITINSNFGNKRSATSHSDQVSLSNADIMPHLRTCFSEDYFISQSYVKFEMKGFRKARYDTFDLTALIVIVCERLIYSVSLQLNNQGSPLRHFYQEPLNQDEIRSLASQVAGHFLKAIQEKTKSMS